VETPVLDDRERGEDAVPLGRVDVHGRRLVVARYTSREICEIDDVLVSDYLLADLLGIVPDGWRPAMNTIVTREDIVRDTLSLEVWCERE
jgi:hypothetical protein